MFSGLWSSITLLSVWINICRWEDVSGILSYVARGKRHKYFNFFLFPPVSLRRFPLGISILFCQKFIRNHWPETAFLFLCFMSLKSHFSQMSNVHPFLTTDVFYERCPSILMNWNISRGLRFESPRSKHHAPCSNSYRNT